MTGVDVTERPEVRNLIGISAIDDDASGTASTDRTPNTVVRSSIPSRRKIQELGDFWAAATIVRNTSVTRDGNFMLANSLVNGVTLVTIEK